MLRIAHLVHRFALGGMENGIVKLINELPADRYAHDVVSLTDFDPAFARRIAHPDVRYFALGKRAGLDWAVWWRLFRLLRRLAPDILHTRNFGTLEGQFYGWLAGVPLRVHGEHGWDVDDLGGTNRRYRRVRKVLRFFVHRFVTVSRDLERYLTGPVGVPAARVTQIYNGVDTDCYAPAQKTPVEPLMVGSVGRLAQVKNFPLLLEAVARIYAERPELRSKLALRVIGTGPELLPLRETCRRLGLDPEAVLPGGTDEIAARLREFSVFVLPSHAEGISNTVLEAMACGLPVIATRVGGNIELVDDGKTGCLIDAGDVPGLARGLLYYVDHPEVRSEHGRQARARVEANFTLGAMIARYDALYRELARTRGHGVDSAVAPPAAGVGRHR